MLVTQPASSAEDTRLGDRVQHHPAGATCLTCRVTNSAALLAKLNSLLSLAPRYLSLSLSPFHFFTTFVSDCASISPRGIIRKLAKMTPKTLLLAQFLFALWAHAQSDSDIKENEFTSPLNRAVMHLNTTHTITWNPTTPNPIELGLILYDENWVDPIGTWDLVRSMPNSGKWVWETVGLVEGGRVMVNVSDVRHLHHWVPLRFMLTVG